MFAGIGIRRLRRWGDGQALPGTSPGEVAPGDVPGTGFYEWTGERGPETPWFMSSPDRAVLALAGLCSW